MDIQNIFTILQNLVQDIQLVEHHNQYTIVLHNKENILPILQELKNNANTSFDMLTDITAIDWAKETDRFEVVYFLYSNQYKNRLRIKTSVDEKDCCMPTVEKIYPSANWYEREVWDMYGIKFTDHSDMRRFYMPEDFYNDKTGETYHPLRKDFPLTGIPDSMPLPPFPERYGKEVNF